MALEAYRGKRNFKATSEPKGGATTKGGGDSFVIQKHDATRLHYDLRLEMDGVLRSWAVTRGPSLVPSEKRLAVHVEDHPLEYGDFEGTIPKKEYGGGTVIVWDRGRWTPVFDAKKGYKKGHLEFELHGEKLHGRWHLVRMAGKPREKRENWLLIKAEDEFARTASQPDILKQLPKSAKTGRDLKEVAKEAPGWSSKTGRIERSEPKKPVKVERPALKGARKAKFPGFIEPALASLRPTAPKGERWLHEIKFDGYRLQAQIRSGTVKLLTRNGLDWTGKFGERIAGALGSLPLDDAIIDGELVVEAEGGASDFSQLQADLSEGRYDRFIYYAFDLLHLDGRGLGGATLIERKSALQSLLSGAPPMLRYSEHFDQDGAIVLSHACRLGLEGIVSKLRDGKYPSGRSRDWIKSKCSKEQEVVIGGYVTSSVSDRTIGSLVLGHYDKPRGKRLIHAGRVGTGFSKDAAENLFTRLQKLRRETSPFADRLTTEAKRDVVFVKPELVAEVAFRNWTPDGLLRHASFRGLREDKKPEDVVREDQTAQTEPKPAAPKLETSVELTHPDRVYWQDAGVTKEGLADYYLQAWPLMQPFVASRPLALLRCPSGTSGQCFFQKHAWKGQAEEIVTVPDPLDEQGDTLVAIDSLDGLIGLVQGAALEIHTWQSTLAELERPDQIVMDLDPGEGVSWSEVIQCAEEVRDRLKASGLESFVKTSGGKGLHVVAPLKPSAGWDKVKAFAKGVAESMAKDSPDKFVSVITKSKRGGKILIDYLRNGRGATAIAPYATRARKGAPVSMPLDWSEVGPAIGPAYFSVLNAPTRLANLKADPWADFRKAEAPLPGAKAGPGMKKKPAKERS